MVEFTTTPNNDVSHNDMRKISLQKNPLSTIYCSVGFGACRNGVTVVLFVKLFRGK